MSHSPPPLLPSSPPPLLQATIFTQSKDGIEFLKQLCLHRAKAQIQQKRANAIASGASNATNKKRDGVVASFTAKREALEKKRDAHKTRITKHIHTLTMKKERLVGFELEKCDEEIKKNNATLETGITEEQEVREREREREREGTRGEEGKMRKEGIYNLHTERLSETENPRARIRTTSRTL